MSFNTSVRGGYAAREGRGGRPKHFSQPRETTKPDLQENPLGELLKTFQRSDLDSDQRNLPCDTPAAITDIDYVTSYNWLNKETPMIMVPGKPPEWTPPTQPHRLREDSGSYFRDPNAARYPEFPLAPVIQSMKKISPDLSAKAVDIIACGSTLGNLLRFTRGIDRQFRFNVEAIGNTVFLVRKENDPRETIPGVRGYGHTFPEAYTTWEADVRGSETHQRIIQYTFSGLKCVVRFESDGYIRQPGTHPSTNPGSNLEANDENLDALFNDFGTTAITTNNVHTAPDGIEVVAGGAVVPQSCIFDLKTRSGKHKREVDMSDIYPQLWVKQIPNFIIAYHDGRGLFQDIRVKDIREEIRQWESENADGIERLGKLLKLVVAFAREHRGLLEVYCPGPERIEIRNQHGQGKHALPRHLSDQWIEEAEEDDVVYASDQDDGGYKFHDDIDSDDDWGYKSEEWEPDYTACSAEDCGYCGKCTY